MAKQGRRDVAVPGKSTHTDKTRFLCTEVQEEKKYFLVCVSPRSPSFGLLSATLLNHSCGSTPVKMRARMERLAKYSRKLFFSSPTISHSLLDSNCTSINLPVYTSHFFLYVPFLFTLSIIIFLSSTSLDSSSISSSSPEWYKTRHHLQSSCLIRWASYSFLKITIISPPFLHSSSFPTSREKIYLHD